MKRTIRFVVLIIAFVVASSSNLWAISNSDIIINVLPNSDAGTVSVKDGGIEAVTGGTKVTIVVSPASGYSISKGNILVEKMVNPTNHAPSRAPGLSNDLQVTDEGSNNFSFVIPTGYDGAYVTATFYSTPATGVTPITSLSQITDLSKKYEITADIDASGFTSLGEFTGELDGKLYKIYNLSEPLFTSTSGSAVIRNIIFEDVSINVDADWVTAHSATAGDAGAVTSIAGGDTRIYNCGILPTYTDYDTDGSVKGFSGSSVGGTDNVGGLVGKLSGNARVINCYSYANITGGSIVGGIVGNNTVTTTSASINTMVMNCMFYGDITGGSTVSPVYGGNIIDNRKDQNGLNTFNYYAYDVLKTKTINDYNCALAVETRFLTRFEIYRQLLNSNKKLAAYYATGSVNNGAQMAKWVLETADRTISNPMPFPVLKAQGYYPSIINPDFENVPDSAFVGRNHGGKLPSPKQTLSVTIRGPGADGKGWTNAPTDAKLLNTSGNEITSDRSITLTRTDMDADRFNFNYDKVQLPYYNDYGTKNYTGGKVVTGWKIVGFTGGTKGTYTPADEWGGYNFADRKCTNKDLYDGTTGTAGSDRVFSQGAYFDVPYGVTGITIEPYWGNAAFVADERYDVVYTSGYDGKTGVTAMGKQVDNWTYNGVSVKTTLKDALGTISTKGTTVYDNAIVLVGNFHQALINMEPFNKTTPITIMSVDLDNDHEPDYSLTFHDNDRRNVCPIRFDFLNIPGTAQAQKPCITTENKIINASVFVPQSWFEITNTCLMYFSQFEYERSSKTAPAPVILLGGVYDQFTSTKDKTVSNTTYLHVGGNAWFKEFSNGTHSDGTGSTKHIPISVTGGDYDGFYLTGTYKPDATVNSDNAECYISSGHFKEAAGAGQEQIGGNVRWQIYNADIDNFFGGGINDAKPILGTVTTDICNSHVDLFCGGPKFGNMASGKDVTTRAYGCVFGKFFGAGYGGNSISRKKYYDLSGNPTWSTLEGYYTGDKGKYYDGATTASNQVPGSTSNANYGKKGPGVATDFEYEFFVWTSGKMGARLFVKFANFSLAQCNNVSSTLTVCTINENFYGGGSLGKVTGTATSVLDSCKVSGNVFGAGYSATLPTIPVRNAGFTTNPNFNASSGMFEPGIYSGTTDYTWKQVNSYPSNTGAGFDGTQVITTQNLDKTNLGSVGSVSLTIKGDSEIGTSGTGHVYGGGDESVVSGDVVVSIEGNAEVHGDVFGGGNSGNVSGSTTVNIQK